jgi:hypothetical protein
VEEFPEEIGGVGVCVALDGGLEAGVESDEEAD